MGVEDAELAADRLGHGGVGVPDHGDVVVGVEVAGAVGGKQPRPFAADDVQGPGVEQRTERTAGDPAAAPEQVSRLRAVCAACAVRAACAVVYGGPAGAGEDHPAGAGQGVQAAGDLAGAEVEELAEDAACAGVVLADVGLMVLVRGRPALRDRQRQRETADDEVAEDVGLLRGQRAVPLVAGQDGSGQVPGARRLLPGGIAHDGGQGDGQIADVRCVVHVAEVDQPRDGGCARAGAGQDVGQGDVGVVEASGQSGSGVGRGRQARQDPGDRGGESAETAENIRLAEHVVGTADIPVQDAAACAVEQSLQGQARCAGVVDDAGDGYAGGGRDHQGSGRSAAARAACDIAAFSMSTTAGSSAGFDTLST